MKKNLLSTILFCCYVAAVQGQSSPITGGLQSNANFFVADDKRVEPGISLYDFQKFGAESWLNLNYSHWGFDMGLRFDLYNNSNLLNPSNAYTDQGIGRWFVRKKAGKLELEGGYIYDQIGAGLIYRAYEERALMIDNALFGIKAGYALNPNWKIKGFVGRQKQQFNLYNTVIRGGSLEGFIKPDSLKNFSLAPGIGVVGRTYGAETVGQIVNTIAFYAPQDSTNGQYNTYAATLFNTMTAGDFIWYVEGAAKTYDVIFDPFLVGTKGEKGLISNRKGYNVYTSLAYSKHGLGATAEFKRTKNFSFRQSPFTLGVQGPINFLPPMAKQNTYRLTTRFSPATQEIDEQSMQVDLRYKVNKKLSVGLNYSDIELTDGTRLYQEITPEIAWKQKRKWQFIAGLQILKYNIFVYQGKKEKTVEVLTPYVEYLYKFSGRKSIRFEAQYLRPKDESMEYGAWLNGLVEFGMAPHWLISFTDMYKLKHTNLEEIPVEKVEEKTQFDELHFPSIQVAYTHKANRIGLAWVKQVEGINCAGGICRYEPAFSGVKLQVNSSF